MTFLDPRWPLLAGAALLVACGSNDPGTPPVVDCSTAPTTNLEVGASALVDAATQGCVQLPAAGSSGAQFLYFAGVTKPSVTQQGTSEPYNLTGAPGAVAVRAAARATASRSALASRQGILARTFHGRLRLMEREAAAEAAHTPPAPLSGARTAAAPPVLGDKRTFNVLASGTATGNKPTDYVQVTGTVRYVGTHAAIYLDDAAPAPTYSSADLQALGSMFSDHLYPIDTTAFGHESDIDGNGLVLILLTDRVTKLASCSNGSLLVGFFLPFDLSPSHVGSNAGEVFYGLTPDPSCNIDVQEASTSLPAVMAHEFQHMISYNQHVLIRGGASEQTWLNEGLSMFAEEVAGRQVPDALCSQNDCFSQFTFFTVYNAFQYLSDPVNSYLIGPDRIPLPLAEYGSAWLFVRWLADHFASDATLGGDLTRALDATSSRGAANVERVTGRDFGSLVINWELANYLDDLPGFTALDPQDQYTSWNFRQTYASLSVTDPSDFPRPFPLTPPTASNGAYNGAGTLLGGSGLHLLVNQDANAAGVSLKLTGSDGTTAIPASSAPFIGVVRIR